MRNKYWIVGVKTLIKKVCRQCISCQRQDSRPQDQATAPLPNDRITGSPPFSVVGVDRAAPLYCTDTGEEKTVHPDNNMCYDKGCTHLIGGFTDYRRYSFGS
ncbi:Gag-pol polyprotein [Elysia marginata]|uniref:Gag-pol polyprotein n=1 Tax=Elysia marginata TaxID=1093978 RepID=A0AAV4I920_9GAST|nr:Gag-pol polyprotein [Elysia marginata]